MIPVSPPAIPFKVVDASVAVKWLIPEERHEPAWELLRSYVWGSAQLIAPATLKEEVASAISRRFRRHQLTAAQAQRAFIQFQSYRPELIEGADLVSEALELSLGHHLSLWDCLYLALAIRYRCDLVTADRQFYRAARQRYPFVALLGS